MCQSSGLSVRIHITDVEKQCLCFCLRFLLIAHRKRSVQLLALSLCLYASKKPREPQLKGALGLLPVNRQINRLRRLPNFLLDFKQRAVPPRVYDGVAAAVVVSSPLVES
jgi:hypothetical protein